ncbi:MAG: EF-hand domain-containing protein [Phycisphaerales bacterium]
MQITERGQNATGQGDVAHLHDGRPTSRSAGGWSVGLSTLMLASAAAAGGPTYDGFELQARSNIVDGFNLPANSSFNSGTPAIADDGRVSIRLLSIGGAGVSGIWAGPGNGSGGVALNLNDPDRFAGDVVFGPGGIYFEIFDVFTDGIWRLNPLGSFDQVLAPGGPFGFNQYSGPGPLDDGRIGVRGGSFNGNRWVIGGAGTPISLVSASDAGVGFLFVPATNPAGRLAGKIRLGSTAGSDPDQIRRYDLDGTFVVLAEDDDGDPSAPFSGFDNGVSITDNGAVAFIASLVGGGRGVFLANDTGITTIATTADPLLGAISFFRPDLNDAGTVVFRGTDAAGLDAVFVGDGGPLLRLVGEHDVLPTDLGPARIDQNDGAVTFGGAPRMNAAGDVVFAATLTPPDNNQIEWGTGLFVARAAPAGNRADVNGDGSVDFQDLLAVLAGFGGSDPDLDVDEDGTVGFSDVLAVLAAWGT